MNKSGLFLCLTLTLCTADMTTYELFSPFQEKELPFMESTEGPEIEQETYEGHTDLQ